MKSPASPAVEVLRSRVDEALDHLLDSELADLDPAVSEPLRKAVLSPGKRIRPLLLIAAYEASGGTEPSVDGLACSVELVHAYSLVHDDLPCMDDDVLRRGQPTLHVRYGEEVAVVAGATLMPLAVRAVLHAGMRMPISDATIRRLILTLTEASGASGMVGGQLLDLRAEGRAVSPSDLEAIHTGKTAELIAASVVMGGIAAGASDDDVGRLRSFGLLLGLAFQAIDDILDLKGSDAQLGKASGRDRELRKATYPAVLGLEIAERTSRHLADAAHAELEHLGPASELRDIANYVIERRN